MDFVPDGLEVDHHVELWTEAGVLVQRTGLHEDEFVRRAEHGGAAAKAEAPNRPWFDLVFGNEILPLGDVHAANRVQDAGGPRPAAAALTPRAVARAHHQRLLGYLELHPLAQTTSVQCHGLVLSVGRVNWGHSSVLSPT